MCIEEKNSCMKGKKFKFEVAVTFKMRMTINRFYGT